jgi:hypothetical protein
MQNEGENKPMFNIDSIGNITVEFKPENFSMHGNSLFPALVGVQKMNQKCCRV